MNKIEAFPLVRKEIYHHFKGDYYQVLGVGAHTETGERLVVYFAISGLNPLSRFLLKLLINLISKDIWCRPITNFCDRVDFHGKSVMRFEPVQEKN